MLRVFFSLGFPKLSFAQYLFGRLEIKEIYDKKKETHLADSCGRESHCLTGRSRVQAPDPTNTQGR